MPRLLLVNPNTTDAITLALAQTLRPWLAPGHALTARTARFGAPYIADESSFAVAAHATLDAWHQDAVAHGQAADAVLIGCFGDPGLAALRECSSAPVTGLLEASLAEAAACGTTAIVTGGERWGPMLTRLCRELAGGDRVLDIVTVPLTGGDLRAQPEAAQALLADACRRVHQRHPHVGSIIIGGAALGGWAAALQPLVPVPLVDSVLAGMRQAWHAPRGEGRGSPDWMQPNFNI